MLLLAFWATVQVAHVHDAVDTSHSGCSLCLVVHASIAPLPPIAVPAPVEHTATIELPCTEVPRDSFVFTFYSRPPPAEPASL